MAKPKRDRFRARPHHITPVFMPGPRMGCIIYFEALHLHPVRAAIARTASSVNGVSLCNWNGTNLTVSFRPGSSYRDVVDRLSRLLLPKFQTVTVMATGNAAGTVWTIQLAGQNNKAINRTEIVEGTDVNVLIRSLLTKHKMHAPVLTGQGVAAPAHPPRFEDWRPGDDS